MQINKRGEEHARERDYDSAIESINKCKNRKSTSLGVGIGDIDSLGVIE